MFIHDWCNWPFDLFTFWGIVSFDKKSWNILLLIWIVSSLIGGSYVDLHLFLRTVSSLEYWHYVNLSCSRVELFKHWSNIKTLVWIVAFAVDWHDWYLFWLLHLRVVFSEKLSNIYLLIWIVPLFINWPDVFFNFSFVPRNVELCHIYNFRLLIELCVKVRNTGLVRESIVVVEYIQNLECSSSRLCCTKYSATIESENSQEDQKYEVAELTRKDRRQRHKFEFWHY